MESLLSIEGVARIVGVVGLPVLIGAVLLAAVLLSGGATHFALFAEDRPRRVGERRTTETHD